MKTKLFNPASRIIGKLKEIPGNPTKVSYGYALGVFLATTPLIGIKLIIGAFLAHILRLNRFACTIGVLHVNGITGPVFYGLAFWLGRMVCGFSLANPFSEGLDFSSTVNLLLSNGEVLICLLVGGLILGIPASLLAYAISQMILKKNHKHKISQDENTDYRCYRISGSTSCL